MKKKINTSRITGAKKKTAVSPVSKRPAVPTQAQEPSGFKNHIDLLEKVNRSLRAYIGEMTSVFRFIETVSGTHSLHKILKLLLEVVKELCAFDAGVVYLHKRGKGGGSIKTLMAEDNSGIIEKFRKTMEIDENIYEWVFRQGQAVIIPESFRKKNSRTFKHWSFLIAPLVSGQEQIGHLELAFDRPQGTFTQQMFSILNVLLKHATVILVNERVYEKERQTAQKYMELDLLKKDVVNTTTHEIKTPLTIIQAASIILEGDDNITLTERKELLGKIIEQCRRIDLIVNELFETAQVDEQVPLIKPRPINLNTITRETLKDVPHNPSLVHFDLNIPEALVTYADPSSIYKVFRNLIENAIKYSPQGGQIVIRAQRQDSKVQWMIKDQGVGISAKEQEQIFDKFFRGGELSTRRVGGIGLGLYIVKKNVELNQGTVRVQSTPGEGTTFTVTLPGDKSN